MIKNKMIMLPREVVEQAIEALFCTDSEEGSTAYENELKAVKKLRAVLEHSDAGNPATAPEGWKLVPVEPTMSMQHAALIESRSHGPVSTGECNALPITYELGASAIVYRAMLDAAPKPPVLDQTQAEQEPYLYYDPENGDTWTQEAIDDGLRPPDGLIALYTK